MAEKIGMDDWINLNTDSMVDHGRKVLKGVAIFARSGTPAVNQVLTFDSTLRQELETKFKALKKNTWSASPDQLNDQASLFVKVIEGFAGGMLHLDAAAPPEQDERREKVNQLAGAVLRLQESLSTIDSAALGWVLHQVDKALDPEGKARQATNPVSAFMMAADMREFALDDLPRMHLAIQMAVKTLPISERADYDPRLRTALAIERQMLWENGIAFEAKETGFAADCFRAVFELANPGKMMDRPKYWLKKALEHTDSMTAFMARNKTPP